MEMCRMGMQRKQECYANMNDYFCVGGKENKRGTKSSQSQSGIEIFELFSPEQVRSKDECAFIA